MSMNGILMANPILIINLGGEMVYIIEQRLKAQNIDPQKGNMVINDLVLNLFSEKLIPQMFKRNKIYSNDFIYTLIQKLAHCSIMKLNQESMSKLYDLIIMTMKLYLMQSNSPYELYQITLRHFEEIESMAIDDSAKQALFTCRTQFENQYKTMTSMDYMMIRMEILKFLQGRFIRVQLFLNDKCQNQDGTFSLGIPRKVGFGVQKPGMITVMPVGFPQKKYFVSLHAINLYEENTSTTPFNGKSDLGGNLYTQSDKQISKKLGKVGKQSSNLISKEETEQQKQQLNQLAQIIQPNRIQEEQQPNFFNQSQIQKQQINQQENSDDIAIQITSDKSKQMKEQILKLFDDGDYQQQQDEEVDLLDLMDKL